MNFLNTNLNGDSVDASKLAQAERPYAETMTRTIIEPIAEPMQAFDFSTHLAKMALFLAEAWKDDHPDAVADSEDDLDDCILAVKTELAIAGNAVGGPAGVMILTGGASAAVCTACKQVLNSASA